MKTKILSLIMLLKEKLSQHSELDNELLPIKESLESLCKNEKIEIDDFSYLSGKLILVLKGKRKRNSKWNENLLDKIFDILTENY